MKRATTRCAAGVVITLALAALAGPLTPPVGPVAPTGKTTQEVFDKVAAVESRIAINATSTPGDNDSSPSLFKITQPGSYYLTGNITGVVGKHGIEIVASGVTIDLNGFDLVGVPGMGAFDGVSTTVIFLTNIAVLNGSVRDWGDEGVDLLTFAAVSSRVDNVRASGNAGNGLRIGNGCAVTNCVAYNNASNGINAGSGCTLKDCVAYGNAINGLFVGQGCTVTGCTTYINTSDGIDADSGSTIVHCTAYDNVGNGIDASNGSTVTDCTARINTLNGIVGFSNCVIRNNTCDGNGAGTGDGAGIFVNGSDSRIEGNNCADADRGIDVSAAGNIIIRNTCSGNTTDWVIAANNIYGPIVDRRLSPPTTTTPAVNGPSATSTLGTTDPNANFTY